jgi:L-fuculose-phosphate aldolase
VIETGLEEDNSNIMLTSSELVVHREIYQNTSALAIVHLHPPYAVALSMTVKDAIIPIEPRWLHAKRKVLEPERKLSSKELSQRVCDHFEQPVLPWMANSKLSV